MKHLGRRIQFFLLFLGILINYFVVNVDCSTKTRNEKSKSEENANSKKVTNSAGESKEATNSKKNKIPSDNREGLRQIIVQMPSSSAKKREDDLGSQSSSSEDYPGKKDDPHTRYVGAFDMVKSRIHVMQPIDNGDPYLARYSFFTGGPITLETLKKTKEERQLANQDRNPFNLFEPSSEDDDDEYSDGAEDEIDAVIKRLHRHRGNSLGNERERKRARRFKDFETNWTKLRERNLQKEAAFAEMMRQRELEYLMKFRPNALNENQTKAKKCKTKKCKLKN